MARYIGFGDGNEYLEVHIDNGAEFVIQKDGKHSRFRVSLAQAEEVARYLLEHLREGER